MKRQVKVFMNSMDATSAEEDFNNRINNFLNEINGSSIVSIRANSSKRGWMVIITYTL